MRGYWLRILLGAAGIFAVGMLVIAIVREGRGRVRTVAKTSDPITIPLPFVPFRIDGERVGTFERLVIRRDAPDDIRSVDLHVELGDAAATGRIPECSGILARFEEGPGGRGKTLHDADFACVRGDSAAAALEPFGAVHFVPGGHTAPLLVPREVANDLRREMIHMRARRADDSVAVRAESIAAEAERTADSISEAAGRMADSITRFHERYADSLRSAALRRADSALRNTQRKR
ncbi:MAG: hypothetical protein ACREOF_00895 [Gemmatimonadales bacterium]